MSAVCKPDSDEGDTEFDETDGGGDTEFDETDELDESNEEVAIASAIFFYYNMKIFLFT